VIERHNDQTLFSTQWKQIFCPPFDPQNKVEEIPSGVWSEQMYQCLLLSTFPAIFLAKQILLHPRNQPVEAVYQKQYHSSPNNLPVRPPTRYLSTPHETGSKLFKP
jgi:hypothetical protein